MVNFYRAILPLKKSKISPPEVQIIDYSSYVMAKKRRNITGLRNQSKTASHAIEEVCNDSIEAIEMPATYPVIHANLDASEQLDNNEGWDAPIKFDSNKLCWELDDDDETREDEDSGQDGNSDVEDEVVEAGEAEWRNEGLQFKKRHLMMQSKQHWQH